MNDWWNDPDRFLNPPEEPEERQRRLQNKEKVYDAKYDAELDDYVIWCDKCDCWTPFEMYGQEDLISGGDQIVTYCAVCG